MVSLPQEWTKLERPVEAPWPMERYAHAACCLNYGEEHPQLLVTGGWNNNDTILSDAWMLDVKSGSWKTVSGNVHIWLFSCLSQATVTHCIATCGIFNSCIAMIIRRSGDALKFDLLEMSKAISNLRRPIWQHS